MKNQTYHPSQKEIKREWHFFDAKNEILGRLATKISRLLIGKHKPSYSPHMDSGDYVVVVNALKVKVTGNKREQKVYRRHSGYPGGFKEVRFEEMLKKQPGRIIKHAVSGMLPDNRLKQERMKRLKVFPGEEHLYQDKFNQLIKDEN